MGTTNYFNEDTGLWEIVSVDESGFPLTEERLNDINAELEALEKRPEEEKEYFDNVIAEAEIAAGPKPLGFVAGLDVINNEWMPLTRIPMKDQIFPSWIEKEDGWYPPIDYPSDNLYEYMWDELEQSWIKYVSMEAEDGSSA